MSEIRCPTCGVPTFTVGGWADLDRCSRCGASLCPASDDLAPGPIVVGVDDRDGGDDALALAGRQAGSGGRELLIVSADSAPAAELISIAVERVASLIVIGASHHGRVGRALPMAVAEQLLRGSPCPVAVAPRGFARRPEPTLDRVGVAYDGSPESALALQAATAAARTSGSRLRLLTALDEPELVGAGWGGVAPLAGLDDDERVARRERAEVELAKALEAVPAGMEADAQALEGPAVQTLVAFSRRLDLLAVGSRSHGPLRRVMVGGVSGPLIRAAHCPVLVTPRCAVMSRSDLTTEAGLQGSPRAREAPVAP